MAEYLILVLDDDRESYPEEERLKWISTRFGLGFLFANVVDPISSGFDLIREDVDKRIRGILTDCFEETTTGGRKLFWHIEEMRRLLPPDVLVAVNSSILTTERERQARQAGANFCFRKGDSLTRFYEKVAERSGLAKFSPLDRFWHDLPSLLETQFGKWVVYTSQGQWKQGDDEIGLYEDCRRQGLQPGEYIVAQVLPDQPEAEIPEKWLGV